MCLPVPLLPFLLAPLLVDVPAIFFDPPDLSLQLDVPARSHVQVHAPFGVTCSSCMGAQTAAVLVHVS
eukprot:11787410-Heterocapsa_arctica.AAC.1